MRKEGKRERGDVEKEWIENNEEEIVLFNILVLLEGFVEKVNDIL